MALLDTTVYVDLRGRGGKTRQAEAQEVLHAIIASGESLFTSRVNVAEMYVGHALSDSPAAEQGAINRFLEWVAILEFTDDAARQYGRLRAHLQKTGRLVGDLDMLIGGIAMAHGEAVVTRNPNHFRNIPGLTIIHYGRR